MAVPAKTPWDIEPLHGLISWDHILNSTRQQVAIVRKPRRKGRPVIEGK